MSGAGAQRAASWWAAHTLVQRMTRVRSYPLAHMYLPWSRCFDASLVKVLWDEPCECVCVALPCVMCLCVEMCLLVSFVVWARVQRRASVGARETGRERRQTPLARRRPPAVHERAHLSRFRVCAPCLPQSM